MFKTKVLTKVVIKRNIFSLIKYLCKVTARKVLQMVKVATFIRVGIFKNRLLLTCVSCCEDVRIKVKNGFSFPVSHGDFKKYMLTDDTYKNQNINNDNNKKSFSSNVDKQLLMVVSWECEGIIRRCMSKKCSILGWINTYLSILLQFFLSFLVFIFFRIHFFFIFRVI